MNKALLILLLIVFVSSCNESGKSNSDSANPQWEFKETIILPKEVRPLSIVIVEDMIWLSDPENNRLLKFNRKGKVLDSVHGLERPMNIDFSEGKVFVPQYLSDRISIIDKDSIADLSLESELNAPASVAVLADQVAIADFYNNRVIVKRNDKEFTFGKEGNKQGEFYYPTDVKLYKDKIYVADAYNNRVQIFDKNGGFLSIVGDNAGINVASGLDVAENIIAVTDQENSRVLIFDWSGNLMQSLTKKINYPTDVFLTQDELWIANFKTNELTVFERKP